MIGNGSSVVRALLPESKQASSYRVSDLMPEGMYTVKVVHELCSVCDGHGYTLELLVPPGEDPTHDKPCWACRGKRWCTELYFEGTPEFQQPTLAEMMT